MENESIALHYFSPSTLGYYPSDRLPIYYETSSLPDDLVEISDETVKEYFMNNPPNGKILGVSNGKPAWVDPPLKEYTPDDLVELGRTLRDKFITITDPMMISDYTISDILLTDEQKSELLSTRMNFKKWPSNSGYPLINFPTIPSWILDNITNTYGYNDPSTEWNKLVKSLK